MSKNQTLLAILIDWANDTIPDYPASNLIPDDLPDRFMTIERGGGERRAMVLDVADIVIDVYDKESAVDCAEIADYIADHIPDLLAVNDNITLAKVDNVFPLNDTVRGYFRYEIACSINYRR